MFGKKHILEKIEQLEKEIDRLKEACIENLQSYTRREEHIWSCLYYQRPPLSGVMDRGCSLEGYSHCTYLRHGKCPFGFKYEPAKVTQPKEKENR